MYELIDEVSKGRIVVMGDFNFAELNWSKLENVDMAHPFVECINNNFLYQLVEEPTRGKNYLDLILSSEEGMIQNVAVQEPFETSDHQIIRFELLSQQVDNKKARPNYDYFRVGYDALRKTVEPLQSDPKLDTNVRKPN